MCKKIMLYVDNKKQNQLVKMYIKNTNLFIYFVSKRNIKTNNEWCFPLKKML